MGFKEFIQNLEAKIFNGYHLPIFKGYNASDKRGAEKIINSIYPTLDNDVNNAKKQL